MKKLLILLSIVTLSACSTMQPPRYSISVDNIEAMKAFTGASAEVTFLNQPANFDSNCRLMGPIEPADSMSIPQFIAKAFNDEMKMAGIFSKNGVKISGDITKIEFSSISGLTNGYWDISLVLKASNGSSLSVSNKYSFKSGFDAITACNATADALAPAVQDLIKAAIAHPDFGELLSKS
ncbi:MAG: hypothetical protein PVI97_18665 [Candidatus Thiodiazotropha sp.]|jgi:hypothetical protein